MSDFVMGARLELDGNFSARMSDAAASSEQFRSTTDATRQAVNQLRSETNQFSQTANTARNATSGLTSGTQDFADAMHDADDAVSDTQGSVRSANGILQTLKSHFAGAASQVKNFASTKITNVINQFKDFKNRMTEGKTGASGLLTALKNVAKASFSALHNGLKQIGTLALDAAKKVGSVLGGAIKGIAKGLVAATAAAGAALGGVMAASINVGKSFEAGMSTVAAISGATGSDLQALEDKAKYMGATTKFSATEAASAMEYMAMAGWKTQDMIGGIEGIMNLAAAAGSDLALTSDIVTDALTAFGMTAAESGRFADVMAAASSSANTNVELMGETFKYVGAAAGAMGYSIEDMAVATGLMANSGIKGSQAGTALRATITRMAKPTKESAEAMKALGVSITNSDGSMKAFGEIMADMRKGMAGMTEDQKASYAAMLGGQESMSGLLAIANATEADFNALTEAIANSAGSAQEMAAIRLDNLEGDITILKSGLEGLGIEIYQGISPALRSVTQMATGMVNDLNTAFQERGFGGLVSEMGNVLATVITQVANYAPQVVDMGVSLIDNLLQGIERNAGSIATGAAKAVTSFVQGAVKMIPRVILVGADLLIQLAQGIVSQLPQIVNTAAQSITSFVNGIAERLPLIIQTALQLVQTLVQGLINNIPMIIQSGITLITSLLQGIVSMLPSIIQAALQLIMALVQGLISNLPLIIQAAVQLIVSLIQGIVGMLPAIIQAAIQLIVTLIQAIIQNLPAIIQAAVQIVVSLAVGLIQAIPQLIAAIPQLIAAIVDTILNTNWLDVGWQIVKGIGSGLLDGVKSLFGFGKDNGDAAAAGTIEGLETNLGEIGAASSLAADTLTTGFEPDYSVISGYGADAAASIVSGIEGGSADALATANNLAAQVSDVGSAEMSFSVSVADTSAMEDFKANVEASTASVTESLTALETNVSGSFNQIVQTFTESTDLIRQTVDACDLYSSGVAIMQGLNNGINSMRGTLMATARQVANSIKTEINAALDINSPSGVTEDAGEFTGEGLVVGIRNMIDKVRAAAYDLSDTVAEPFQSQAPSAISATGAPAAAPAGRSGLQLTIQNLILQDVGNKDPQQLVAEIMQLLYEKLADADEIISGGEMGVLL